MNERPIFVTGGAGFIGSAVARRLVSAGNDVAMLLKPTTDTWRIDDILPRVRRYNGDVTDILAVEKIIHEIRPRGVIHFAASNIKSGINAPDEELMRVNFLGTVNLLRALADIDYEFFLNTGSFLEYGVPDHPARESDRCEPSEVYSLSKLSSTLYGMAVAKRDKKPVVTFRLFSPYGPKMEKGRLLYELTTRALLGLDVSLTRPGISRDFIFVEDIVDMYLETMAKAKQFSGEIFNIGTGVMTTLGETANQVLEITKSTSMMKWGSFHSVAYDSDISQADMEKTFRNFLWRPKHNLELGLEETINWYRSRLI